MSKDIKGKKNISKKSVILLEIFALVILVFSGILLFGKTFAASLDNDVEVELDSELTYYLKVSYDGVDKYGVESTESKISEIYSGVLLVEDKIPDGLEFNGFVTTSDGSIGAVRRNDESIGCKGKVIDDTNEESVEAGVWNDNSTEYTYHGLHYNSETKTVSFQVKNLQAGCELMVGIKTKTPSSIDEPDTEELETRRDFYNFASVGEGSLNVNSNTVHVFIGNENVELHDVKYEYTGEVPKGSPDVPETSSYAEGTSVGVASTIEVEGYTFSGWKTEDVEINNGSFKMPDKDVTLKGFFTKKETYKVIYSLKEGTPTPEGYVLPREKEYSEDTIVKIDSMKKGDVFHGYCFLGWKIEEVEASEDGEFVMPSTDVHIIGEFEEVTYEVSYKFYDGVQPENADDYLPSTKQFKPGVKVTLEDVTEEPDGYKFLGWYKESEFKMPEEDVVVYGEWKEQTGTFTLEITKEVVNKKDLYEVGDTVEFKITVSNKEQIDIRKIMVKENNDNAKFIEGDDYEVSADHMVIIPLLQAGKSVEINAEYTVTEEDSGWVTNEVEILGALADNNYELEDKDYKATAKFKTPGENPEDVDNNVVNDEKSDNPNTLDNILKYVVMGLISLVTIIGICLYIKKMKKRLS